MPICERCKKETRVFTTSFFNEDTICMECENIEQHHPDYEKAKEVEHQEVLKGNYNFEGVGLPEDYDDFVANFKKK